MNHQPKADQSKTRRNLIVASVIFILALGVGGFYLWSQKKADLTQNKAESQKSKVESQKLGMKTNAEKQEDKTKLIQEFENFIKNHGKKIELEKIDTTDWKTYTDKERGFSFKYPKNWVVIEKKIPKHEIYEDCHDVLGDGNGCVDYQLKTVTRNDVFLCVTVFDKKNSEECYVTFEEKKSQIKKDSSIWSILNKRNEDKHRVYGKNNIPLTYTITDLGTFLNISQVTRHVALFAAGNHDAVNVINKQVQKNNIRVIQKTDINNFSYYTYPKKDYYIQVNKKFEKPFFGIINSIAVQEKE